MISAIYGAGSLGTILGAYITKAGYPIDLINHNRSHIAALKAHGAEVTGTVHFKVPVSALLPEEMSRKYDLIFLMTKQLDNINTVRSLLPFLAPDGVICTLQNGLPELAVAQVIGEKRTYGCTIGWGASLQAPGISELSSDPEFLSFCPGSLTNNLNDPHYTEIIKLLRTMGTVEPCTNFIGARWTKILINCAFTGFGAVLGYTIGEVAADKQSRKIAQKVIKECFDVADAAQIRPAPIQGKDINKLLNYHNPVKKWISYMILPLTVKKHASHKGSLLQDLEKGKLTEIDSINGIVCGYGKKYGTATPCNDKVVEVIHLIEQGKLKPERKNLSLF